MTLDDLAALEKAATSAPWRDLIASSEDDYEYFAIGPEHRYDPETEEYDDEDDRSTREQKAESDAAFIAAIRNAAPFLIEVARAAKGFRDHGEAKNGTHATILFEALARLEGVGK